MKSISDWQKEIFEWAVSKGWWPMVVIPDPYDTFGDLGQKVNKDEVNIPEKIALMHSELSEALEFYRSDVGMKEAVYYVAELEQWFTHDQVNNDNNLYNLASPKPDGFVIELADCVIRIMDFCGAYDIDLEEAIKIKLEYNKTRPFKHGGKKC